MRAGRRDADPVGAPRSGKSPDAIIWKSSSAHSLNVSSCRLGVRCAPRFVCRVMTATGSGATPVPVVVSRRMTGTARTRVGISSYQSGADESTMRAVANASVTRSRHCGLICWPTKSR